MNWEGPGNSGRGLF